MVEEGAEEVHDSASLFCINFKVVLEAELSNSPAIHLYEKLGFIRDKSLFRYYLKGSNAVRLKLWLK